MLLWICAGFKISIFGVKHTYPQFKYGREGSQSLNNIVINSLLLHFTCLTRSNLLLNRPAEWKLFSISMENIGSNRLNELQFETDMHIYYSIHWHCFYFYRCADSFIQYQHFQVYQVIYLITWVVFRPTTTTKYTKNLISTHLHACINSYSHNAHRICLKLFGLLLFSYSQLLCVCALQLAFVD